MYSRAVSQSFKPYVLGAAHHWQKWNASPFPPWHFELRTLPRTSDTRVNVRGGLLVSGISQTRRDSMAPKTGRVERNSQSRIQSACRTWPVGARVRD